MLDRKLFNSLPHYRQAGIVSREYWKIVTTLILCWKLYQTALPGLNQTPDSGEATVLLG